MLFLIAESGQAAPLEQRVKSACPGAFHVLEVGKIEADLSKVA